MTIADMVYEQVKALPEPLAREVLDFVAFLRLVGRGHGIHWPDVDEDISVASVLKVAWSAE